MRLPRSDLLGALIGLIWLAWVIYWWFVATRGNAIQREESVHQTRVRALIPFIY